MFVVFCLTYFSVRHVKLKITPAVIWIILHRIAPHVLAMEEHVKDLRQMVSHGTALLERVVPGGLPMQGAQSICIGWMWPVGMTISA